MDADLVALLKAITPIVTVLLAQLVNSILESRNKTKQHQELIEAVNGLRSEIADDRSKQSVVNETAHVRLVNIEARLGMRAHQAP